MMTTKEDSIQKLEQVVTDFKADHEDNLGAVVIVVDRDNSTVKLLGMGLDETEIIDMLEEAATIIVENIQKESQHRVLN